MWAKMMSAPVVAALVAGVGSERVFHRLIAAPAQTPYDQVVRAPLPTRIAFSGSLRQVNKKWVFEGIVDSRFVGGLREGQVGIVRVPTWKNMELAATIQQVTTLRNKSARVELSVVSPNLSTKLPAVYALAEVSAGDSQPVLSVPMGALTYNAGAIGVWVVHGKQVAYVPVQVGRSSAERVEVLSGLQEGDSIVIPTGHRR